MAGQFDTQIGIGVKDNTSGPLNKIRSEIQRMAQAREQLGIRSEHTIQREIDKTAAAYLRLSRSGTLSANEQQRAYDKMTTTIARLNSEMMAVEQNQERISRNPAQEARAILGIRSEQSVQREISRTIAAYNRLERSGVLSANDQKRAYEQMTATVAKLRRELGETERAQVSLGSRLRSGLTTAAAIGGGAVAAGMVLKKPVTDAASYDAELRKQANFAYSDRDAAGRELGMKNIDSVIRHATDVSGESIDEAFSGLETMQRSGVMTRDQAFRFLPNVLRNAKATGADAASVANTQASAVNFGLKDQDAMAALSVLTTMAQHGRIDVPDLAREMPRGLEAGKSAGFYGSRGFSQLSAFFEASAIGAKDPQDAATNANDFLAELTSSNLANNAKHIKIHGKGIDIRSAMRYDLAHGKNALDTVSGVIGKMDSSDPEYVRLERQIASAGSPEERAELEARRDQIHGQHVSELFPNQQARNAYLNFDRNRDVFNKLTEEGVAQFGMPEGKRSADLDLNVVKNSSRFKFDREQNARIFASNDAMNKPTSALGNVASSLADLEKEFPALGAAVSGVTTAFEALGASLGGGFLGSFLVGGGVSKVKDWLSKPAANAAGEVADVVGDAAEAGGKALKPLGKLAKLGIAGDALMLLDSFYDEFIKRGKDKLEGVELPSSGPVPHPVGALDAWDEIKSFLSNMSKAGNNGSASAPAQPINIYLDSQLMTQHIMRNAELNSRRSGS